MKRFIVVLYVVLSIIFLFYLSYPVDLGILDFPALPESVKSSLSGDTVQVPEVSAYFSDNYRTFVIPFYYQIFADLNKLPFKPLRLNYPPEFAFVAIKDQTQSTYLEEFVYPMRSSLFVNGLEPFDEITKKKRYSAAKDLNADDGNEYETKVTLRYYQSSLFSRMLTWFGVNAAVLLLYLVIMKARNNV